MSCCEYLSDIIPIIYKVNEDTKIEVAILIASCNPVYLTIPEYVFIVANTNTFTMSINNTVFTIASQSKPLKLRFCLITNAKNSDPVVNSISRMNIIHLGTIFNFFTIIP
jgi:hypothetical protein